MYITQSKILHCPLVVSLVEKSGPLQSAQPIGNSKGILKTTGKYFNLIQVIGTLFYVLSASVYYPFTMGAFLLTGKIIWR